MSSTTVYLVTGGNRGIGFGLVEEIITRHANEDVAVFAGARNPDAADSLKQLQVKYPGKIHIVKYVCADVANNQTMAKEIKDRYGYVDTVIANAAIGTAMGTVLKTKPEDMHEHFDANPIGLVVLFQAVHDLLKASTSTPKFILISSAGASLTKYMHVPVGYVTYGASKAASNYIIRKIHFEHEWLVAFPLAPGIVETDMAVAHRALDTSGILAQMHATMAVTPAQAAVPLIEIIDHSTREKDGGEFLDADGSKLSW